MAIPLNDAAGTEVMVVDDDPAIRSLLGEAIEIAGFAASFAENGAEALRLLERGARPGVIITDIIMPEIEGLEVIRRVRRLYPDIRLVAISGGSRNVQVDFLKMAARLGAHETLSKPFGLGELQETVRRLFDETAHATHAKSAVENG